MLALFITVIIIFFSFIWGFSNRLWWIVTGILSLVVYEAFFTTKKVSRYNPDLRTRVEPKIGMSLYQVLEETTLGPHLEGCIPTRHFDMFNSVVDKYYVGWGVVTFVNFELDEIYYF